MLQDLSSRQCSSLSLFFLSGTARSLESCHAWRFGFSCITVGGLALFSELFFDLKDLGFCV